MTDPTPDPDLQRIVEEMAPTEDETDALITAIEALVSAENDYGFVVGREPYSEGEDEAARAVGDARRAVYALLGRKVPTT